MNNDYWILKYWKEFEELYVEYMIVSKDIPCMSGIYTNKYYISELDCDYDTTSNEDIKKSLKKLIKEGKGKTLTCPKVSELSPLLKYVYDFICESEANMCLIDYYDWHDMIKEGMFKEDDLEILKSEVNKYKLNDHITVDDGEYIICAFGDFRCCFNNDTIKEAKKDGFEK